ncbi:MAG: DsbA family protein [Nanoarchaeota archaeon]|nr:DsbA family protein [Nanoarchaeota archaeon]
MAKKQNKLKGETSSKKIEAEQTPASNETDIKNKSGNYVDRLRDNPWIVSTLVLGIVIVLLIGFVGFSNGSGIVSEKTAADNLVSFIKSQNSEDLSLSISSVQQEGQLYKVTLNYQGEEVPIYVSLDGKFLVSDVIPLDKGLSLDPNSNINKEVDAGDSPVKGKAEASVTIIEFSDYQCPFCQKFYETSLPEIEEEYIKTGKVKLVYKDFPLNSIHPEAQKAAESAHCVREQKGDEGYFKMHDKLFENQQSLSVENYKKWARSLGVVGAKFDKCIDEGVYSTLVKEDLEYGESLGVSGTPAFFINGKMISGAQPFDVFKQAIDSVLEEQIGI